MKNMKVYNKKLYKSKENKVISGVMGGLGEYFDIDPVLFRAAYVAITVFSIGFPGVIAYILMAIVIPNKPETITEEAKTEATAN
jgi:phage shock protein C